MTQPDNVRFFDAQFRRQLGAGDFELNPFEREVLPHLRGRVLDAGCGLGNLSIAAAERGCTVLALDASATAIEHLRTVAQARALPTGGTLKRFATLIARRSVRARTDRA